MMHGFWTGTYGDVTESITNLGLTIADIGLMLRDCGKIDHFDYEQVNKMAVSFLHPKSILLDGSDYIMVNGINMYDDIRDGLISHRLGQFYESGQYWGHAGAQSLFHKAQLNITEINFEFGEHWIEWAASIQKDRDHHLDRVEAMKESMHHFEFSQLDALIEGVLYGALGAEIPHAATCLRHPRNTWERFGGAMHVLKFDTLRHMVKAVDEIG